MRKAHLLTTVAASLLLSTAAIAADKDQTKDMSNPAPAAQQSAPAEKIAPTMRAGERKAPETTGQATKSEDKGKADLKSGGNAKSDIKPAVKSEQKVPETTGQAPKASEPNKSELNESRDKSSETAKKNGETKSAPAAKSGESTTTTGQGAAAGSASLSTEQRSKITSILKSQKAERANLNISVRIGASVPESVHYYPLPIEVVEVYPEWRGYDFILVGDEILIINPRTHMIVAVLAA